MYLSTYLAIDFSIPAKDGGDQMCIVRNSAPKSPESPVSNLERRFWEAEKNSSVALVASKTESPISSSLNEPGCFV